MTGLSPAKAREYRLAKYDRHPGLRADEREKYYARGRKHTANNRTRWTSEESRLILTAPGVPDADLSATLGRSVASIQVRRSKLRAGTVQP